MSPEPQKKKSFVDNLIVISLSLSALIIGGGLLLILFSDDLSLEGIFGPGKIRDVNFETLVVSPDQNHYLSCPEDYCSLATPDQFTDVYPVGVDILSQRFLDYIDTRSRVEKNTKRWDIPQRKFEYLVYHGANPFPDIVTIQFFDLGGNRSSLAIFSITLKGDDQNNTNRDRVINWLNALENQ